MTLLTNALSQVDILPERFLDHVDIEAAALYGSTARGDSEAHSDIDLLLFTRNQRKRPIYDYVVERLSQVRDRLSVVIYSQKEIDFLNDAKSLFLLHLSREAIVLFDKTGYLSGLLRAFEPKPSYLEDFTKSTALLDPLRTVVRGSPNQLHRLSYTYSLFRVFGVYLLAERGIYEFSKAKMARQLAESLPSLAKEVESLSSLRALNSNFFTGGKSRLVSSGHPDATDLLPKLTAISTLVGRAAEARELTFRSAVDEFSRSTHGRASLDYRLRMWFLLLVYDGLNLYLEGRGMPTLTDLTEQSLAETALPTHPKRVREASERALDYLHRYPLKYFLDESSRIAAGNAQRVLFDLCDEPGLPITNASLTVKAHS